MKLEITHDRVSFDSEGGGVDIVRGTPDPNRSLGIVAFEAYVFDVKMANREMFSLYCEDWEKIARAVEKEVLRRKLP